MADYSDPSYVKQMVHVNFCLILLKEKFFFYLMAAKLKFPPSPVSAYYLYLKNLHTYGCQQRKMICST